MANVKCTAKTKEGKRCKSLHLENRSAAQPIRKNNRLKTNLMFTDRCKKYNRFLTARKKDS